MKDYGVVTVKQLWTKKRILNTLIAIFFILFIIIAIITYYGQNVGCFTISVSQKANDYSIYISDDEFKSWSPRLICEPMSASAPTVEPIVSMKKNEIRNTAGTYKSNDKMYIGYTFWLRNMSETEAVNIKAKLDVARSTNGLDECSWVWFFDSEDDSMGTIYQKSETLTDEDKANRPDRYEGYDSTTYWASDSTVFEKTYLNLQPGETRKFTLILWTDLEDPQCVDSIIKGEINYNLTISLDSEE